LSAPAEPPGPVPCTGRKFPAECGRLFPEVRIQHPSPKQDAFYLPKAQFRGASTLSQWHKLNDAML